MLPARPVDGGGRGLQAVEKILERWSSLSTAEQESFLTCMVEPLAKRLKVEILAEQDRVQFLEDFLAAMVRRQHQMLG
jgi:hypothetical protein